MSEELVAKIRKLRSGGGDADRAIAGVGVDGHMGGVLREIVVVLGRR